jgi:tripartite-type tricarboxylate transporter receptor subunit TctC
MLMKSLLRNVVLALFALASAQAAAVFPDQRVTIVVPYSPGGPTDLLPRLVAPELQARWGQPVLVENRTGAAGLIGTEVVAKAKPDGHTLVAQGPILTTWKLFVKDLPFDPLADLKPIALFGSISYVVVTNPQVPAKTLPEFIALAKAKPKAMNYATIPNSGFDLDYVRLQRLTGTQMVPVAFPGAAPSALAVMRNDVQLYMGTAVTMLGPIAEGKLTALGVTGRTRLETFPNVPTVRETGLDFTAESWTGILAPGKTPDDVIARIASDFNAALKVPAVAARLKEFGLVPPSATTPQQYAEVMQSDARIYGEVARAIGLKPQ